MENMGLIWSIVRRFSGRGYELEDLFQIGSIGLLKAIDKFDSNYAVNFSTYAVPMRQVFSYPWIILFVTASDTAVLISSISSNVGFSCETKAATAR